MIQRFVRDTGQNYYNIFERILIALIDEYYSKIEQYKIYDAETGLYNTRKVWWIVAFIVGAAILFAPIYIAAFMYVINSIT